MCCGSSIVRISIDSECNRRLHEGDGAERCLRISEAEEGRHFRLGNNLS